MNLWKRGIGRLAFLVGECAVVMRGGWEDLCQRKEMPSRVARKRLGLQAGILTSGHQKQFFRATGCGFATDKRRAASSSGVEDTQKARVFWGE